MESRPTLQHIADAASVGKSTVSLALRNDPRLLEATRQRIQAIAEELGYKANPTVAALMAQLRASRTQKFQATLGLINASSERDKLSEFQTFRDWVSGCKHRGTQLGYSLDEFWLWEPGIDAKRLATILNSRGIRGLIVTGVLNDGLLSAEFSPIWNQFACVVVGVRTTRPKLHCASNDQYATSLDSFQEGIALGYQRPGLVIEKKVDENLNGRFSAGFLMGQLQLPTANRIPTCDFNREDPKSFEKWFRKHQPDVIITLHAELMKWLPAMNFAVPEQVGLIHLDRSVDMTDWAGMNQNNDHVGVAALDMLVGALHRAEFGIPAFAKSMMIESDWVPGATVSRRS